MFSALLNSQNKVNPIRGVASEEDRYTAYSVGLRADLTGAIATGYTWSRIGGTYAGPVSISPTVDQRVTANNTSNAGTANSIFRCVITYSGGSVNADVTIQWGLI